MVTGRHRPTVLRHTHMCLHTVVNGLKHSPIFLFHGISRIGSDPHSSHRQLPQQRPRLGARSGYRRCQAATVRISPGRCRPLVGHPSVDPRRRIGLAAPSLLLSVEDDATAGSPPPRSSGRLRSRNPPCPCLARGASGATTSPDAALSNLSASSRASSPTVLLVTGAAFRSCSAQPPSPDPRPPGLAVPAHASFPSRRSSPARPRRNR